MLPLLQFGCIFVISRVSFEWENSKQKIDSTSKKVNLFRQTTNGKKTLHSPFLFNSFGFLSFRIGMGDTLKLCLDQNRFLYPLGGLFRSDIYF